MSKSFRVLGVGFVIATLLLVLAGWSYWEWLTMKSEDGESGLTIVRNLGFVLVGVYGLLFAFWRSWVTDRQAGTAQRRLTDERYQKGAEMLGSDVLPVRLGGIYALQGLAEEDPKQYHVQIMRLFCAFARNPVEDKEEGTATPDGKEEEKSQPELLREDIQDIINAIGTRSQDDMALEDTERSSPNLQGADLRGGIFAGSNLSKALLAHADLTGAILVGAHLTGAYLIGADLTRANLTRADLTRAIPTEAILTEATLTEAILTDAILVGADLTSTLLSQPIGLTQVQLDQACADPNKPPCLEDCFDAETGEPLVWHRRPPQDKE